jgi:hypothetical protein
LQQGIAEGIAMALVVAAIKAMFSNSSKNSPHIIGFAMVATCN